MVARVWPWLALQDSITYGTAPDSFQAYLRCIVNSPRAETAASRRRLSAKRSSGDKADAIDKMHSIDVLPGLAAHSAEHLRRAGVNTVGQLLKEYERRDRNPDRMHSFLRATIPRAHPIPLSRLMRWISSQGNVRGTRGSLRENETDVSARS